MNTYNEFFFQSIELIEQFRKTRSEKQVYKILVEENDIPNKETRIAYQKAIEHGCCVCRREYNLFSPATIHHLTGGGMGLKSKDFIPL